MTCMRTSTSKWIRNSLGRSVIQRLSLWISTPLTTNSYSESQDPGLGTKSAWLIVNSRRFNRLTSYDLKKMGVVMKKAKYFITCNELTSQFSQPIVGINELHPERLRPLLISKAQQKRAAEEQQLKIDFGE